MKKLNIYILLALATTFASCATTDVDSNNEKLGGIGFKVGVLGSSATRGEIITPDNQVETFTNFGVYAFEQTEPRDYSTLLMNKQYVEYNKALTKWVYSNFVKWPSSGLGAEFFAYAPHKDDSFTTQITDEGELKLHYTRPDNVADQVDVMVADHVSQTDQTKNVPLVFNHKLSALAFKIHGMGDVKIKSIGFRGGYESGDVMVNADTCVWSNRVFNKTKEFKIDFNDEKLTLDESLITANREGYMMMIPQDIASESKMFVRFINGAGEERDIEVNAGNVQSWEPSKIYTYSVTIKDDSAEGDLSIDNIVFGIYVDVEPWINGINVDSENLHEDDDNAFIDKRREVSNCYMFDSTRGDQVYYIPVDERIFEFWSGYEHYTGDELASYTLAENDEWYPDIIWYTGDINKWTNSTTQSTVTSYNYCNIINDINGSTTQIKFERLDPESDEYKNLYRNEKVTATECTTNFVTKNAKAIMKITLPCETLAIEDTNIFVAVKKNIAGTETILWSWHFWVTDYNPNLTPVPTEKAGNFRVGEGDNYVQQYIDASDQETPVWGSKGMYQNKYMMDRNLGMFSVNKINYTEAKARGDLLYYQFGRKEPYPYDDAEYHTKGANFPSCVYYWFGDSTYSIGMIKAIQLPWHRFRGSDNYNCWFGDPVSGDLQCLWNDENISRSLITDVTHCQKSMFDPSPLGWKLPVYEAWSGILEAADTRTNIVNITDAIKDNADRGATLVYDDYVVLTSSGYYLGNDFSIPEGVQYSGSRPTINIWTASPDAQYKNNGMCFNAGYVYNRYVEGNYLLDVIDDDVARVGSFPVRCVQE